MSATEPITCSSCWGTGRTVSGSLCPCNRYQVTTPKLINPLHEIAELRKRIEKLEEKLNQSS